MRIKAVDFLRFWAVLLVMLRHFNFLQNGYNNFFLYNSIQKLVEIGWIGVDMFFVISGFLVSGLIFSEFEKTNAFNAKRFLIRRGFKIYPTFYILILLTAIIFWVKGKLELTALFSEIFYYQNYSLGFWSHTWSLAVEEHFYFILAFLFWIQYKFFRGHQNRLVLATIISLIVICNVFRIINAQNLDASNRLTFFTHFRIDALFFGVFIRYVQTFWREAFLWWQKKLAIFIVLLGTPLVFWLGNKGIFSASQFLFGYTFLYFYFGNLLVLLMSYEANFHNKFFSGFAKLGFYSYSIYLWHMPCKFWVIGTISHYIELNYFINLGVYIVASFVLGVLSAKIVEMPFLKLRNKLFP